MLLLLASMALADETPPVLLQDAPAVYPPDARERGLQGVVELQLSVDTEGNVVDAKVVRSPHDALDDAALSAARKLRFEPAAVDGQPVAAEVGYRFVFSLGSSEEGGIARPATLHGVVEDTDGLPLNRASITVRRADGTGEPLTEEGSDSGRFDLAFLPPGVYIVAIDREGFQDATFEITLGPGETLQSAFTLAPENALEVVVYATRQTWREIDRGELVADTGTVTGVYELTRRDIESTPGSLEDVTRAAHALPGVASDGDMLAGFHVRGGEQDEVVYLLDRVPLENPFHLAGFNSLFNPDMIDSVRFYAGAAPAQVPSATSAVMDVTSWDGAPREPGGGIDGAVDLSASSARIFLMGPLDEDERFTFALAARRTYMEGYFQVMKWVNVIDSAFAAPEFSELSARAAWRPGSRTRVMVSALRSGDSLALVDSDDDSLVNFQGAFELKNSLSLLSADHRYTLPNGLEWQTTLARTWDRSFQRRDLAGTVERTVRFNRSFIRSDLVLPFSPNARIRMGGDLSRFQLSAVGDLEDNRALPTWTQAGIGDFGFDLANIQTTPDPWTEANGYVQTELEAPFGEAIERSGRTFQPALKLRAGLRVQAAGLTGEVLPSPRMGASLPLPTGTVPKVSYGMYQRVLRDPVQLSDGFGNPELRAERASHWVVGVDQALPLPGEGTGGLVRVEAYHIDLDDLVVTPDDPEALARGTTFANAGSGRSRGLDVMVAARMGRFNAQLAYGLLFAERENPLNVDWPRSVAPPQDQRHTLSLAADYQLFAHWRMTGRYSFHTGRPISRVDVADPVAETLQLTCLNCDRLGPTHQIDLRAEWRRAYERYRMTFYLEVLNIGNIQSDFLPIHDVIDGELSTTMLRHLPMRPFLGLRADF